MRKAKARRPSFAYSSLLCRTEHGPHQYQVSQQQRPYEEDSERDDVPPERRWLSVPLVEPVRGPPPRGTRPQVYGNAEPQSRRDHEQRQPGAVGHDDAAKDERTDDDADDGKKPPPIAGADLPLALELLLLASAPLSEPFTEALVGGVRHNT